MDAPTYAKTQLESVFGLLNTCADGMDEAQYNHQPEGTCNRIAQQHVHTVSAIDFFINTLAAGGEAGWPAVAEQHGFPANPLEIWKHDGAISPAAIKEYAADVQRRALEYLGTLTGADLDRVIDTQFFGKQTVAFLLQLAATHTAGHAGDIAAIKGIQGLKGLPF